jgi:hypothetical protein
MTYSKRLSRLEARSALREPIEQMLIFTTFVAPDLRLPNLIDIGDDVAAEREGEREDMFGNGVEGVVADVGDDDPMRLGVGFIDDVRASRGDGDIPCRYVESPAPGHWLRESNGRETRSNVTRRILMLVCC